MEWNNNILRILNGHKNHYAEKAGTPMEEIGIIMEPDIFPGDNTVSGYIYYIIVN